MLRNFILITLRNLRRHATYSFINIIGLAVGLASAIVIGIWVFEEVTYEKHFANHERIYRVGVNFYNIGDMAPGPENFIDEVKRYSMVEKATRLDHQGEKEIIVDNQDFKEEDVYFVDENFFSVFSYGFIAGDPAVAMEHPNNVILTKEKALQFFNTTNVLGKTVEVKEEDELRQFVVSGVVDTENQRSHIPAEIWFKLDPEKGNNWTSANYYNYVKLKPGIRAEEFESELNRLIKDKIFPTLPTEQPYEEWVESNPTYKFISMPITDIYLKSVMRFEPTPGGNEVNVKVFSVVVIVILLIAGVNYVNLTTARASKRAKEVGVRKTLGTSRKALIAQFLAESVFFSVVAFILALLLADLFNSVLQQYIGMSLVESLAANYSQIVVLFLITLTIGFLAGIYPAFYMSSFNPISAIKGQLGRMGNGLFRNVLVVAQFSISIVLIASTLIIYRQLHYINTKDIGLNKENVMVISNAKALDQHLDSFVENLKQHSGILSLSKSARIPAGRGVYVKTFRTPDMQDGMPIQLFYGDHHYLETMGFRLLEGRNFSEKMESDTAAVLLNESAVRELGLTDAVGTTLNDKLTLVGVVSDFNFEGPHANIEPAAIMMSKSASYIAIKTSGGKEQEVLDYIQQRWDQFQATEQLEYYFLDESYAMLMEKEQVMSRAVSVFSVLAIIISCLGLYGLSAFICEQRTKEIGIRKVFGAQIFQVMVYLNKHFTKPILISMFIAIPIGFWLMSSWLNDFAYRTAIEPWIFVVACLAALIIAWVTVSWQSFKTAIKNPVESLKTE